MSTLELRCPLAPLPYHAHRFDLTFQPGAFGEQRRVPIRSGIGRQKTIGLADVYEDGGSLWANLVFDLTSVAPGAFPRTLPTDNRAAARAAMTLHPNAKVVESDPARKLATRARVVAVTVLPRDPAGETIGAMIDAAAKED
jgi:hypothetical protein